MPSTRIELHDLRLVREVVRLQSLTAAGRRLHLSASALSHRLAKLETYFGKLLFERVGKCMVATPAAQRLAAAADDLLSRLEEIETELRCSSALTSTPLRVTASCPSHGTWVAQILGEFSSAEPELDIQLTVQSTDEQLQSLRRGEADFAITAHPPHEVSLLCAELFSVRVVVLVSDRHPLAEAASPSKCIPWNALAGETLLIHNLPVSDEVNLLAAVNSGESRTGRARHTRVRRVHLPEAIGELVRAQRGVGVLCHWNRIPPFDMAKLAVLSPSPRSERRFWGVWRRSDASRLPLDSLVKTLRHRSSEVDEGRVARC